MAEQELGTGAGDSDKETSLANNYECTILLSYIGDNQYGYSYEKIFTSYPGCPLQGNILTHSFRYYLPHNDNLLYYTDDHGETNPNYHDTNSVCLALLNLDPESDGPYIYAYVTAWHSYTGFDACGGMKLYLDYSLSRLLQFAVSRISRDEIKESSRVKAIFDGIAATKVELNQHLIPDIVNNIMKYMD